MRRTVLVLLVLFAIMLGAGAAGTPVNGDSSVAATTAGINLGHRVHTPPRVTAPTPSLVSARDLRLVLLVVSSMLCLVLVVVDDRHRSLLRAERRPQRGPPALVA